MFQGLGAFYWSGMTHLEREEKQWLRFQQHGATALNTPPRIPQQSNYAPCLTTHTRQKKKKKDYIKHNQVHPAHTCTSDSGLCACSQGHEEATHYLSLSVKEEEVLRNVCRLSSKARERGSARERGGAPPRERGAGCWEQLRS